MHEILCNIKLQPLHVSKQYTAPTANLQLSTKDLQVILYLNKLYATVDKNLSRQP